MCQNGEVYRGGGTLSEEKGARLLWGKGLYKEGTGKGSSIWDVNQPTDKRKPDKETRGCLILSCPVPPRPSPSSLPPDPDLASSGAHSDRAVSGKKCGDRRLADLSADGAGSV